jgi:hypothetical protein
MRRNEIIDSINEKKKYLELFTDGLNDLVSNILAPVEEHLSDDKMQLAGDKLSDIYNDIDIIIKKMDNVLNDLQKKSIWDEINEALVKIEAINKLNERVILSHNISNEYWNLKIYPKNNKTDIKSFIMIEINPKSKRVNLEVDRGNGKDTSVLGCFFGDDGKIKYSSTYIGHIETRLRELLKGDPYSGLEKLSTILNEYACGNGIIDKYFDISDYYYDTQNIHGIKFREACSVNFIKLFGGKVDYFKPIELMDRSSENKDPIKTIYETIDLLCIRFYDVNRKPGGAYIEFADCNELKIKNDEMEEKITFVFDDDKISIFESNKCLGYIEYIEEVNKYKFVARKSSMDDYDKMYLFRSMPDDFKDIIIRLNSILLTSLNYDKNNWFKFIEDQIRVLSYTSDPIEISFWIHMLKNLIVENYEI